MLGLAENQGIPFSLMGSNKVELFAALVKKSRTYRNRQVASQEYLNK
jgi:hypothetical protein